MNLLDARTADISLRRDALLEGVIAHEIAYLVEDLPTPNSDAARSHIEHHLKLLLQGSSKQVSLTLSPETAEKLEAACKEKNVPREAFLNRVILLLVAKPGFVDAALFGLDRMAAHEIRTEIKHEYSLNLELENGFAPLPMIADILADPFWGYRAMTEKVSKDAGENYTFYGMHFHQESYLGLNCHIPDHLVPGTKAYIAANEEFESLVQLGGKIL
jgi:hypothetical protein